MRAFSFVSLVVLGACSPYLYQAEISSFDKGVSAMTSSVASMTEAVRSVPAETGKLDALALPRSQLSLAPECVLRAPAEIGCAVLLNGRRVDVIDDATVDTFVALNAKQVEQFGAYVAALAAVTNAKDRAELDAAWTNLSASLAGFSPELATLISPGIRLLGLTNATVLDARRLRQLRQSVTEMDPVLQAALPNLRIAVNALAEIHYAGEVQRLGGLQRAIARTPTGPLKRSLIEEFFDGAKALRAAQKSDPGGLVDAMAKAHGELAVALRERRVDGSAFVAAISEFANAAADFNDAVSATN